MDLTLPLVELTLPFVVVGGYAILYKGLGTLSEELEEVVVSRCRLRRISRSRGRRSGRPRGS